MEEEGAPVGVLYDRDKSPRSSPVVRPGDVDSGLGDAVRRRDENQGVIRVHHDAGAGDPAFLLQTDSRMVHNDGLVAPAQVNHLPDGFDDSYKGPRWGT